MGRATAAAVTHLSGKFNVFFFLLFNSFFSDFSEISAVDVCT